MGDRWASRLSWASWALSSVLAMAGLGLLAVNGSAPPPSSVVALVFPTLGALIASRRPRNPIGWIFCLAGFFAVVTLFTTQYALYGLATRPLALPGAAVAAWVSSWAWVPAVGLVGTLCLLLFPDGRLPSPRWRPVLWVVLSGLALFGIGVALRPWDAPALAIEPTRGFSSALALALRMTPGSRCHMRSTTLWGLCERERPSAS